MDAFVFGDDEDLEKSASYGPGGLYPVKLGDVFGPEATPLRYRVAAKLGRGASSTVWMARDLVAKNTVAVKLVRASESPTSLEAAILEHLREPSSSEPSPVLQLRDSFKLNSANGIHQVLVTEPVILLQRLLKLPGIQVRTENLVRQALEGLAFIHERGIAHGDLHPSNIGVAVPDADHFTEIDVWDSFGAPYVLPLVTYNHTHDAASFPPYLTYPLDLGDFLARFAPGFVLREPRVRILDLGCAYFAERSPPPPCRTPIHYAAPEVVFPLMALRKNGPWDRRTDIWSLACTIVGGGALIKQHGDFILDEMAALCGGAPDEWIQHLASTVPPRSYTSELAEELWAIRAERLVKAGQKDARGLLGLLRRMLIIDPVGRGTATELLQDPYLAEAHLAPETRPSDHNPFSTGKSASTPVRSIVVV
ncbi:kinase-like domain-containing protein [Mycena epipterygia]|nr:kinase-like domain-containing protein [Mycena epipterygia]